MARRSFSGGVFESSHPTDLSSVIKYIGDAATVFVEYFAGVFRAGLRTPFTFVHDVPGAFAVTAVVVDETKQARYDSLPPNVTCGTAANARPGTGHGGVTSCSVPSSNIDEILPSLKVPTGTDGRNMCCGH